MRVAIVDNLPEGGAKRVVYEHVKGLSKNHQVMHLTNRVKSVFDTGKYASERHEYDLSLVNFRGVSRILREVSLITKLVPVYGEMEKDIEKFKADIVIVHPCMETQAPMILPLLKTKSIYYMEEWLRVAYEMELHQIKANSIPAFIYEYLRRQYVKYLDGVGVNAATLIIANSQFSAERATLAYGKLAKVCYPGVDTEIFKNIEGGKKDYFLWVGEESELNGWSLIEKAKRICNWPFEIKVVKFKEGNNFGFTDEQMVELYSNAVATLCLAHNEPFGLTAIESMACSTPVVAVSEGGYKETVVDGETGVLIERNADELVRIMKKMSTEKEWRDDLGNRGRVRMKKMFSWKNHVEILEQSIKEALGK